MKDPLFLGLDSSTQGLKATLIDADLNLVHEQALNFDREFPEFETEGGVHIHSDGLTVTSPPLMWVAALDALLDRMKEAGVALDRVVAVSGSGQQHGSVWLGKDAAARLQALDPERTLREQLDGIFTRSESPIWMDASTTAQCRDREARLGGPQVVADVTGSRAYERFTGNQIAKVCQDEPAVYDATGRIALVSSFIASLLLGDMAPIDVSDGSGMNLLNIRTSDWDADALSVTAPGLADRLGAPVASHAVVGSIHAWFVRRYGFNPACRIIAFSGDNPNSLAGLRLQESGDIAVSLGTSDTVFGSLSDPHPSGSEGHIFVNPVDPAAFMAMTVYTNGSLTREGVRDREADGSWEVFNRLLSEAPVGNDGSIGITIDVPEITPPILTPGTHRFAPDDTAVEAFAPSTEVRAVVESRFLSMRLHAARIGITPRTVLATGGASANAVILQVMADVLGVPVNVAEKSDSASLGAAYRAVHGWRCAEAGNFVPFAEIMQLAPPFQRAADPDPGAVRVYDAMLPRFAQLEARVAAR